MYRNLEVWTYRRKVVKIIKESFVIAFEWRVITSLKEANAYVPLKKVYAILKKRYLPDLTFRTAKILYLEALEKYLLEAIEDDPDI